MADSRQKTAVRYHALASTLRRRIVRGRLKPGAKLPPVNELIKRYGVSRNTAVHAMRVLAEEGLVRQEVGRGTFVRHRLEQGEIAVVLSSQLLAVDASAYYRLTASVLMSRIASFGRGCRGRMHLVSLTGSYGDPPYDVDLLEPDVLPRLRGVLSFHALHGVGVKLLRRGVPVVSMATTVDHLDLPQVRFNQQQAYHQALTHLYERGVREVAIFSAKSENQRRRWGMIEATAREVGIALQSVEEEGRPITEQMGWRMFRRYHAQRPACRAILVNDEMLCRGVLRAAMQCNVRFPEDYRLATFAIAGETFPYDQPLTRVDMNPVDMADAAFRCMQAQADDMAKHFPVEWVTPTLVEGATI